MRRTLLIGIDRDGTLTTNDGYFATKSNWRKVITLNVEVVNLLKDLQTKYVATTIVLTNQSGVARKQFSEKRVQEVNKFLDKLLRKHSVRIDNWQFCPDVDTGFAKRYPETHWNQRYVRRVTKRKPSPQMLLDGLRELGKSLSDFEKIVIIGDHADDQALAHAMHVPFINVKGKTYTHTLRALKDTPLVNVL